MSTVIVGASMGTLEPSEQDLSPVNEAGFTWLHLEGNHYLRVKDSAPKAEVGAEITVVGVAGSGDTDCAWLLLG